MFAARCDAEATRSEWVDYAAKILTQTHERIEQTNKAVVVCLCFICCLELFIKHVNILSLTLLIQKVDGVDPG